MQKQRRPKVFVGMSGGVDSSVAAALLKRDGYEVVGVFMKNWADPKYPCPWEEDRRDAMRVAAILDIPFETWDFVKEYREAVVGYMLREYAVGRTPNPDVRCNREIKFGLFLRRALESGADFVATGHYVRKYQKSRQGRGSPKAADIKNQNFGLAVARDENKDQSYFLWTLTQEQLRHALFPIGEYTKPEVRKMARSLGLPTAEKPDSQGICFVGEIDVREFLKDHIRPRRGRVLTAAGKKVGEHEGAEFYTIGQRHGFGGGGGIPFYVADKNVATNTLVVAEGPNDDSLFSRELAASDVNWISGRDPEFPLECEARIRYRQPLQPCTVVMAARTHADLTQTGAEKKSAEVRVESATVRVMFNDDQRAITPGQSIVFYKEGQMLGGAIIA